MRCLCHVCFGLVCSAKIEKYAVMQGAHKGHKRTQQEDGKDDAQVEMRGCEGLYKTAAKILTAPLCAQCPTLWPNCFG